MTLPRMWTLFGADHLPYRLLLLARMIDRQASRQLQAQFDLSLAEWRVLAFICASGPASASAIGRAGGIDRAEISRAVARLEAKGLATRERDGSNRKRLIITATRAGRDLFEAVREDRRAFFRSVIEPVAEHERSVVERALAQMAERIDQLSAAED
jgi:DNA-binding MarR family transcriptional regulator